MLLYHVSEKNPIISKIISNTVKMFIEFPGACKIYVGIVCRSIFTGGMRLKKLLKVLSVLQIVIGILGIIVAAATLGLGKFMNEAVETSVQQQALTSLKVSAVLGLLSSIFDFGCGYCGLKGSRGDRKKLSAAVKLGWLGLAAALVSGVLVLYGDATANRIYMVASSCVVPVLFLISAKSVKNSSES